MNKIITLLAILFSLNTNAQTWKIWPNGPNPVCAGGSTGVLVADSTNSSNWYSSSSNGRTIDWYTSGTGCTGTVAQHNPAGSNAYFFTAPSYATTMVINAHLSTGQCLSYTLTVDQPPVTSNSPTICSESTATLTASGASTYTWNTSATGATIAVTPTITTHYTVTGTDINGCTNKHTSTVTVNTLTASITANSATICPGATATLTASGTANSYSWNTGATTASITDSPTVTTSYNVTGTFTNGYTSTATSTITVKSIPFLQILGDTVLCTGNLGFLVVYGTMGCSCIWNWSTGASTNTITIAPTVTTTYSVIANGSNGCTSYTPLTVTVNPSPTINC